MREKILNTIGNSEVTQINPSNSGQLVFTITNDSIDFSENIEFAPLNIPNIEIFDEVKEINLKRGQEGELVVTENKSTLVDIDINGDLIINDRFADCYSINSNGELIYSR